jgi:hypothetical protein
VPTSAEIAYREAIRSLDGQGLDLESIRTRVGQTLAAGGVAAAFLGGQNIDRGPFFWIAVGAFAALALATVGIYRGVSFKWDRDTHDLVNTYVDKSVDADLMMRELTVHIGDDYNENRAVLDDLFDRQSWALLAFGIEVLALMINLVLG